MDILYVGTDSAMIQALREETSFRVTQKNNFVEALQFLKLECNVEAIVAHYESSGNNGLFFYKEILNTKICGKVPFILIQNAFDKEVIKQAFSEGVKDYFVATSTEPSQIIERIKTLQIGQSTVSNSEKAVFRMPWSKRIFDIVVASAILLILSPLLLLVVLAIRIESKGKVYYTSKRVGRKTFDFYKLRSMRVGADSMLKELAKTSNQYVGSEAEPEDAEPVTECKECAELPDGVYCSPLRYHDNIKICEKMFMKQKSIENKSNASFVKIVNDPRITKVGKIIRNTSIDELPQLINVIKGDMSLVGNRPLPIYEAECLTNDQLSKRFLAPAGITGLWQIELRGKGGNMSEEERIRLDNQYAEYFTNNRYSFWYDMKLLLKTVPALFQQSTV